MSMDRKIEKKKWPRKRIITYSVSAVFAIVVVYLLVFQFSKSSLKIETERLTISVVKTGPFQEFIPIIGNVLPNKTIYLVAEEGGRVEVLYLEAGAQVKAGDKILKLTNTSLLMTLLNNEAQVNRASNDLRATRLQLERSRLDLQRETAQANYALARIQNRFDRNKELFDNQIISKQEFEDFKDEYEFQMKNQKLAMESQESNMRFQEQQVKALEISVIQMQSSLELLRAQMDSLTVRAPISGHLTSLTVEKGQSTRPGERFGQIDEMEGFKVRARIDEHYLDRVKEGQIGKFEVSDVTHELRVTKVFPEVTNGQFEVDMEFVGKDPEGIRRGQTTHIRLELSEISQAIQVERGSFFQSTGGNWAFVVDKGGEYAEKRPIKLGRQNPDYYEVLEGLKPGDKVITSSYDNFGKIERLYLNK